MSRGLVSLQLRDFCQFKKAKVPLLRQGLVWLGGENRDTDSAVSNGAGKSNLLKAIGWCLFGETPENEAADDVIREGAKRARVILKLEGGWKITRERYKGAPKLTLSHKGNAIRGKRAEIQERIEKLIGLSWRAFLNVCFYASRDGQRFVHPRTSNADRQKILFNILNGQMYADALEWVRDQAKGLSTQIATLEVSISEAKAQLETYDLERLKRVRKAWESQRDSRIEAVRLGLWEVKKEIGQIAKRIRRRKKLETQRQKAARRFRRAEVAAMKANDLAKALEPAITNASKLRATIQVTGKALSARQGELARLAKLERCPTCQTELEGANAAGHLRAARDTVEEKLREVEGWSQDLLSLESDIEAKTAEIRELRELDVAACNTELQQIEIDLAAVSYARNQARQLMGTARERAADIKRIQGEPNPYDEELELARQGRRKAKDKIAVSKGEIQRLEGELSHWEFWKRGFSPMGLPSFVLDAVMPELTDRANHYLETLSDRTISVVFSTQRELTSAKGEYRDEINVTWTIEGVQGRNPSGGQWRKIEIATDLALMDLARSQESGGLDFLALDEVLDGGIDAVGRSRLITLLHDARKLKGTIFVVSQDTDLAGVFDRSVIVTKRGGISKVRIAA